MSKDEFSGIIRSGSSHSVSVSEHTGNAKTPKNIVRADTDGPEAKKIAFEKKKAALIEAKQTLAAAVEQHVENVAGVGSSDPNIQNVDAGALESNKQKLGADKGTNENRQAIGADALSKANIQGVNTASIASNLQSIGADNISANRKTFPKAKASQLMCRG